MNKDQVKGAVKDAGGKVQKGVGKALGDTDQQAKGEARQVEGKTQKGLGNVKKGLKEMFKKP
jgi:uncharacterized protein YjbJ (UPF0337 family)